MLPRRFLARVMIVALLAVTCFPEAVLRAWTTTSAATATNEGGDQMKRAGAALSAASAQSKILAQTLQKVATRQPRKVDPREVQTLARRFKARFPRLSRIPGGLERTIGSALRQGWRPTDTMVTATLPRKSAGIVLSAYRRLQDSGVTGGTLTIWDWSDDDPNTWKSTVESYDPDTDTYTVFNVEIAGTEVENELVAVWDEVTVATGPLPDAEYMDAAFSVPPRGIVSSPFRAVALVSPLKSALQYEPCYVSPSGYMANYFSLVVQKGVRSIGRHLLSALGWGAGGAGFQFGYVWWRSGLAAAIGSAFGPAGMITSYVIGVGTALIAGMYSDGIIPTQWEVLMYYGCQPGQKIIVWNPNQ